MNINEIKETHTNSKLLDKKITFTVKQGLTGIGIFTLLIVFAVIYIAIQNNTFDTRNQAAQERYLTVGGLKNAKPTTKPIIKPTTKPVALPTLVSKTPEIALPALIQTGTTVQSIKLMGAAVKKYCEIMLPNDVTSCIAASIQACSTDAAVCNQINALCVTDVNCSTASNTVQYNGETQEFTTN
jgi:hypothetical protein